MLWMDLFDLWNNRIHLFDAFGRLSGHSGQSQAVLCFGSDRFRLGRLFNDSAEVPGESREEGEIACRSDGIARFSALQTTQDGHLFHLLYAVGCVVANNERFCQPIHHEL